MVRLDELNKIINDQTNLWQRMSRLVRQDDFARFWGQYVDKSFLLEAIKMGSSEGEAILKSEMETWKTTDWQSKTVPELRMLAASYGIEYASKLPRDLLLLKLEEALTREKPKIVITAEQKLLDRKRGL